MRRLLAILPVLCLLTTVVTVVAAAPPQAPDTWAEFARNTSLGTALQLRDPSAAELKEVQTLADLGLKQSQEWVKQQPSSAAANYALGSWLLYAYRTLPVEELNVDASGNAVSVTTTHVVQGLNDEPTAGLEALRRAAELAPDNTTYLLDYAAALADYDRPEEASGLLKGVWATQPAPPVPVLVRTALLLAGIAENQGDLIGARDWYYNAIALYADLSPAVEQLRMLDSLQIPPPVVEEQSTSTEIEGVPEQPETTGDNGSGQTSIGGDTIQTSPDATAGTAESTPEEGDSGLTQPQEDDGS